MKVSVLCLVVMVMALCAVAAQATVLTFDDIIPGPNGVPIADGYGGLDWDNFWVVDGVNFPVLSGYQNAVVSPNNVAFNAFANPASMIVSSPDPFHLNSAYLTAAWNNGLTVQAVGSKLGVVQYTDTFVVDATGPTLVTFSSLDVDEVTFTSFGGTTVYDPNCNPPYTHFAMDNLKFNEHSPIPEPFSIFLAAGGLGSVLAFRRRKA